MEGKIIRAPDFESYQGNLVFLAGPIQGAEDWQQKAISTIMADNSSINIASPRGDYSQRKFSYDAQVDWETAHLNQASKEGVILFWLAKEKEQVAGRSYAQTTRYELAEWVTKYQHEKKIKLALGIEPGFSGERYIRKRLAEDCPEVQIHSTLEDTCQQTLNLIKSKQK